jgi:hypothetical protein
MANLTTPKGEAMSLKLGSETGSLVNHLMSASGVKPEPGMGATILYWTDRTAATIVRVVSEQTIDVQADRATRIDDNGMSEVQVYEYTPNPAAPVLRFRLTKRGWRCKGAGLAIGERRQYHDYGF